MPLGSPLAHKLARMTVVASAAVALSAPIKGTEIHLTRIGYKLLTTLIRNADRGIVTQRFGRPGVEARAGARTRMLSRCYGEFAVQKSKKTPLGRANCLPVGRVFPMAIAISVCHATG